MRALLWIVCWSTGALSVFADDYQPRNTQREDEEPPSPIEALYQMTLPEGFEATLFAHEPAVRQPIAMTLDDRGRLWVVESYSYEEWQKKGEDRILILEDTDGDGRHDKRTVFWDQGKHFAGIALGFGGVWVCDAPNVVFIPDRDGDDKPDGPAEIVLDGWTIEAEHNMVNGLKWGPDGWLYGQHGVLVWSKVGLPGTPEDQRQDVNCGIWRYHPQRKIFENVARGTTNPWGMDWDEHGELFMSGNVNGHLWHVVPGSFLERMHPTDKHPYVYERITMSADQPHYMGTKNWKRDWKRNEIGRDGADQLGGGHSHCGAMIYLGDNWPESYRGSMFMCNTHGRRVNQDILEPRGSTFMGKYVGDFAKANQSWFRGVTMLYGPDGGVYLSDWTDDGECHDSDGVHRTSGRIFKITYKPNPIATPRSLLPKQGLASSSVSVLPGDLAKALDQTLLSYHRSKNAWIDRQSRRVLHERAVAGTLAESTIPTLQQWADNDPDSIVRLRARWTLHCLGADDLDRQLAYLSSHTEHEKAWAVRLLADYGTVPERAIVPLSQLAKETNSALVRLYLASTAQRMPVSQRSAILSPLASRLEDTDDRFIPLMVWYAAEPVIATGKLEEVEALLNGTFPKLQRFIARRLVERHDDPPLARALDSVVADLPKTDPGSALARLRGLREGIENRPGIAFPEAWQPVVETLLGSRSTGIRAEAARLAVRAGNQGIIDRLIAVVSDVGSSLDEREQALGVLLGSDVARIGDLLLETMKAGPSTLRLIALQELPKRKVEDWAGWLFSQWTALSAEERSAAVDALAARLKTARPLVDRFATGEIGRQDISASQAHQLAAFNDAAITQALETHWGSLQQSSNQKRTEIERYRTLVLKTGRKADLTEGQMLFQHTCAACHQLFDEGGALGPDLTGSDRGNLDYLLNNIVDPSASVAADYRLSIVTRKDGRVITGSVVERNRAGLVVRHLAGEERVSKEAMQNLTTLRTSLMPEGLLQTLTDDQVINLIGYLRARASAE